MQTICSAIKQALTDHLVSQLTVSQVRDLCIVTLPLPTLDNRWVDVFVEPRAADFFLIHDGGKAVNELILQGLKMTSGIERELTAIAERLHVAFSEEMFQTGAKIGNLGETVSAVGMCSALAMTHLLATARAEEEPIEGQILELLKQWGKKKSVRIQERVKVEGNLKQHQFDFTVTPRKGPTFALSILNPTAGALSAAERFGFKAQDLDGTPAGGWRRIAVEAKSEVWSQEARKLVDRVAHSVIPVPSGSQATYGQLAEALEPIAS